jgi:hypothetical protein
MEDPFPMATRNDFAWALGSGGRFGIGLFRHRRVRVFFAKILERLSARFARIGHPGSLQFGHASGDPTLLERLLRFSRDRRNLLVVMKQAAAGGDQSCAESEKGPRLHKQFLTQFLPWQTC